MIAQLLLSPFVALGGDRGLSWGVCKGIKTSLLVHTCSFMVSLITFAMEIILANKTELALQERSD